MMPPTLLSASIDGAIFVAIVWILSRAVRTLSPAARTVLWWAAAAKFLIALVWVTPVVVPILPVESSTPLTATIASPAVALREITSLATPGRQTGAPAPPEAASLWPRVFAGLWVLGLMVCAGISARRWRQTVAVTRRSVPAPDALHALAADLAGRLHLRRTPDVRMSGEIDTPLVAGIRRPVILLPRDRFEALNDHQQQMALCHELAHVKRADLWFGCVPAIAERLFFFHPLAHVASREYALWREAACDAAVLRAIDAAPGEYGQLLLSLGVSPRQTGLAAAGTPWSFASLKRRITMLQNSSTPSIGSRLAAGVVVALALAALVPLRLAARQAIAAPSPEAALLASGSTAEASLLAPGSTTASLLAPGSMAEASLLAPFAAARAALTGDLAPQDDERRQKGERELNFVFFVDDNHTTMSGSMRDIDRARRFKRPGEPVLWFRHGGREYVIRDRALLSQIEATWAPVNALGNEQGKLGAKQGDLGSLQGEIGAKQGEIGAAQGKLGERQGVLGDRQGRLAEQESRRMRSLSGRESFEHERRTLDQELRTLDEEMRFLDSKMRELEKPMRDLDDQMRALDREMELLDQRMQAEVKRAEAETSSGLERAIAGGIAEAVR
jgi:bla regulator protein BlaR1